ncbi:MAG: AzlC family ABC transporter permease [Aliihoeflea sp.]
MRDSIPMVVAAIPFGLLFGALAVENGLTVTEAILMSAMIYAGASQMVGIDLFGQQVAPWVIALSIFAVNFRHVLYSAAIGRRLGHWSGPRKTFGFFFLIDQQFAESERRVQKGERISFAWYMGLALPVYVGWIIEAGIGAVFGGLIENPEQFGLDFVLPIYFLALVMGFRKTPGWLPIVVVSAVASIVAFHAVGSPWHVSIGAMAGILLAVIWLPGEREKTP